MKAVLLTLIGLGFVAMGVFLLLRGDPQDRTLAWGIIAFFGACATVGVVQLLPARRATLGEGGALVLRPLRAVGLLLAGLAMGVGCLCLAPYANTQGDLYMSYVAYFGALFFGGGSAFALWRVFGGPPLARIDTHGVETFGSGAWKLAWRDVLAINFGEGVPPGGFINFVTADEPFRAGADDDEVDEDEMDPDDYADGDQRLTRTLYLTETGLAPEDVHAIADELWRRHRVA